MKSVLKPLIIIAAALLVACSTMFALHSCKKESKEALMIVKTWTLVKKTIAGIDVTLPCEKDGKYDFKKDNTYTITNECPGSPKTGTWELNEDAKTLKLNGVGVFEIKESSPTKLIIAIRVAGANAYTLELK